MDDVSLLAGLLDSIWFNQNMILYETSFIRLELCPSLIYLVDYPDEIGFFTLPI